MSSSNLTSLLSKASIVDGDPGKEMPLLGLATQLPKPSSKDGDPATTELSMSEVYEIQSIKGKGQGLIALSDIERGTRLLCEPPLLTTEGIWSTDQVESRLAAKLKCLSNPEQRRFLSLHNNFPGKKVFSGIVKTNALPLGSGSPMGGIFPTISRINHSCCPNTQHTWNSSTKHETIHAIRDITKGEEITISYDPGGPSQSRREHLRENFRFDCTCELCSLPAEALKLSDDRQRQIQSLDEAIGDSIRVMTTPGDALADCHKLQQLLEAEGITDARVARIYYDAFQICITHGDQARASLFAKKAYESRLYLEGEDSPEAQRMKSFFTNPSSHRNFGTSQKWRQPKKRVPKNLDGPDFDRWLWRVGT